ncbi:hypothetical protein ONZ43_g6476 [Nemania bipapillata]|uniref:Uncharacterized protein n=1 Tax=Nemania bipapillata TaxID=110536 RepID=A0ACC2HZV6_9PEZI|nr:hypothetical protein ONZ43_g6476 [Nemania bipapillata]
MALNTAFAAALNPAKMDEVRIWYLSGSYAKMDVKSVAELTAGDRFKTPAHSAPKDPDDVTEPAPKEPDNILEPADPSIGLLSGSVGFGKSTTPTSVSVFGIMEDDKKVCMISPTVWPLAKNVVATEQAIAASRANASAQPGKANTNFVYFIKTPSGNPPGINRVDATTGKTVSLLNASPKAKSRMCAAYISPSGVGGDEVPFLYYMQSDKMVEYNVYNETPTIIRGITSLPDTTPMALCEFKGLPYLFWFSNEFRLMYSKRQSGTWTAGVLVPGNEGGDSPPPADSQSDLDVVTTNDQLHILVFYLAQESENPYDYFAWMNPV